MSILTANQVNSGDPVTVQINKNEIKAISKVSSDANFSNDANWKFVTAVFKHDSSNRRLYTVLKDFNGAESMVLKPQMSGGDNFQISKLLISKADRSFLTVKRSEIPSFSNYDFTLKSPGASAPIFTRDFPNPWTGGGFEYTNAGNISNGKLNILYGEGSSGSSYYSFVAPGVPFGPTYKLRLTISGALSSNLLINVPTQPARAITPQEIAQGFIEMTYSSNGYGSFIVYFGSSDSSYGTGQFSKLEVFTA